LVDRSLIRIAMTNKTSKFLSLKKVFNMVFQADLVKICAQNNIFKPISFTFAPHPDKVRSLIKTGK
jgi:hypothetical protein